MWGCATQKRKYFQAHDVKLPGVLGADLQALRNELLLLKGLNMNIGCPEFNICYLMLQLTASTIVFKCVRHFCRLRYGLRMFLIGPAIGNTLGAICTCPFMLRDLDIAVSKESDCLF